jgi:hypothetical protein
MGRLRKLARWTFSSGGTGLGLAWARRSGPSRRPRKPRGSSENCSPSRTAEPSRIGSLPGSGRPGRGLRLLTDQSYGHASTPCIRRRSSAGEPSMCPAPDSAKPLVEPPAQRRCMLGISEVRLVANVVSCRLKRVVEPELAVLGKDAVQRGQRGRRWRLAAHAGSVCP